MNISDIGEVTSRKKINENVEKLREKVNRENAKIIKMKVAQDTSYWDLKEKLRQVEGNHERLQQNMVELQMQYEAVSMKYQDEIRLRSDTLNKVASMKAIVDVIEDCMTKVSNTLSRTRSDCTALANAYATASKTVSELHDQYLQLQRTKTEEAHEISRFMEELTAKSESDTRAAMNHVADILRNTHLEITQKNEEMISSLQLEVKRLNDELNAQKCNLQAVITNYEIKVVEEARRADEFRVQVRSAEECINILRDQLTGAERERSLLKQILDNTKIELQESVATAEHLKKSLSDVNKKNQQLAESIDEKNQEIGERQQCIDKLSDDIASLSMRCAETEANLKAVTEEKQADIVKNKQLAEESRALRKQLTDTEEEYKKYQEESERKAASTRNMISGLMGEVQAAARTADTMQTEIHTLKANAAAEQDSLRQEEGRQRARADNLQFTIKTKDKEITDLKTAIQDKNKEIEWLKSKIRGMQQTIDNIQKEVTTRVQVVSGDRDKRSERPERDTRTKRDDNHDVYNYFSNSGSDSDALPMAVIKRQSDALKERARESRTDCDIRPGGDNIEGNIIDNDLGIILGEGRRGQSSVSEVKNDLNTKKRTFFKSENRVTKAKKIK